MQQQMSLENTLAVPVAAAGMLTWLREQLTDPDYFRTASGRLSSTGVTCVCYHAHDDILDQHV